jgi:hypothetical protein
MDAVMFADFAFNEAMQAQSIADLAQSDANSNTTAISALQADVDQNEADSDTAEAANATAIANAQSTADDAENTANNAQSTADSAENSINDLISGNSSFTGDVSTTEGTISGFDAALNDQTGVSYNIASSDNGKVITLDNANAITLTIPSGLGDGFNCLIVQKGDGQITLSASGTNLINRQGHSKTAGRYAVISIVNIGNDNIIVGGDTSN